jgi:Flp pilus assembly CpaE family ATPase
LPRPELTAVERRLSEAGYLAIAVDSVAELERLLVSRDDVRVAILDGETNLALAMDMHAVLHAGQRSIPALVLVPQSAFGQVGLGEGGDAADEYFTRPYSAESLRWRVEAMMIRAHTGPPEQSREAILADPAGVPLPGGPVADTRFAPPETASETSPKLGKILIVFNPKGGVGKTTLSINLATALQIRKGQRVLLVDCDTITGHIAPSLGLGRPRTLLGARRDDAGPGAGASVADIATVHGSGVGLLVMADAPLNVETLEPGRVVNAVNHARASYDWVILDMHPNYGPLNRALFNHADMILVPVTPDIPCIRAAAQFRDVATELGIRDRLALVINRANGGLKVSDVELVVDLPIMGRIRSAGVLFGRAADEGRSAVERFPKAKVVADIEALAGRLVSGAGPEPGTSSRSGWRSRFAGSLRGLFGRHASQAS